MRMPRILHRNPKRAFIDVRLPGAKGRSWSKIPLEEGWERVISGNSCPKGLMEDVNEMKAVKAEKWEEAITALRAAVAADPTPRHYREGVIPADYLPQYYLFVAYARSGDMVNAAQYSAARGGVPTQNDPQFMLASAAFSRWQSDNAMAASSTMAAAQSAIRYDALIKEGDAALTAKNYAAALSAYDQARSTRGIDDARKRAASMLAAMVTPRRVSPSKLEATRSAGRGRSRMAASGPIAQAVALGPTSSASDHAVPAAIAIVPACRRQPALPYATSRPRANAKAGR